MAIPGSLGYNGLESMVKDEAAGEILEDVEGRDDIRYVLA